MSSQGYMNYDPNLTNCGRMAKQKVRLTFGVWKYRTTRETIVGGNCLGLEVIDCAVSNVFEELDYKEIRGEQIEEIILEDADGNTLHCDDDEDRDEEWLKNMLVAAEILEIVPDKEGGAR